MGTVSEDLGSSQGMGMRLCQGRSQGAVEDGKAATAPRARGNGSPVPPVRSGKSSRCGEGDGEGRWGTSRCGEGAAVGHAGGSRNHSAALVVPWVQDLGSLVAGWGVAGVGGVTMPWHRSMPWMSATGCATPRGGHEGVTPCLGPRCRCMWHRGTEPRGCRRALGTCQR